MNNLTYSVVENIITTSAIHHFGVTDISLNGENIVKKEMKALDLIQAVEPTSLTDLGYKVSKSLDTVSDYRAWAKAHIKGFPADVSKEDEGQVKSGMQQRYSELKPAIEYGVVEGNYVLLSELASRPKEVVKIGVEYAFSMSNQEFGKMREKNPSLHGVIKEVRTNANKYVSNAWNTLIKESKPRNRSTTDDFITWLFKDKGGIDTIRTRCKNAKVQRQDDTADTKKLEKAIIAFKVAYQKID